MIVQYEKSESAPIGPMFIVDDVSEEYFIIRRMCCPRCGLPTLKPMLQKLVNLRKISPELRRLGASGQADNITVKCSNCGHIITLTFHLSTKYINRLQEIANMCAKMLKERKSISDKKCLR